MNPDIRIVLSLCSSGGEWILTLDAKSTKNLLTKKKWTILISILLLDNTKKRHDRSHDRISMFKKEPIMTKQIKYIRRKSTGCEASVLSNRIWEMNIFLRSVTHSVYSEICIEHYIPIKNINFYLYFKRWTIEWKSAYDVNKHWIIYVIANWDLFLPWQL